jgi:hypothetical protein
MSGIRASARPQTAQDELPPRLVNAWNRPAPGLLTKGTLLSASSRLLRVLPGGRRFYVARTSDGRLIEVMTFTPSRSGRISSTITSGMPLSVEHPLTVSQTLFPLHAGPFDYGLALNGITSVSFLANGAEKSVPVVNNVWFYDFPSGALRSITVHYATGRLQTITH